MVFALDVEYHMSPMELPFDGPIHTVHVIVRFELRVKV